MAKLELSPERAELLRQTVEEVLHEAEKVLEDIIDDKLPETRDQHVELFDTQHERVEDLRELLKELEGMK